MNAELRQLLREEIDARTRRTVVSPKKVGCAGCGCHLDNYVAGCRHCNQRHVKREREAASRARQTA